MTNQKKFVCPDLTTMHYGKVKFQDDIGEKPDMFLSKSVKNIFQGASREPYIRTDKFRTIQNVNVCFNCDFALSF